MNTKDLNDFFNELRTKNAGIREDLGAVLDCLTDDDCKPLPMVSKNLVRDLQWVFDEIVTLSDDIELEQREIS
jgi:RNAse (barnase) inhibitor barstar